MNYYETLGVSRHSEPEVIEAAYRALMKKYHPDRWHGDKAEAEPRAKLINEAYSTLRDPRRRSAYDKLLSLERPGTTGARRVSAQATPSASTRKPVHRRKADRNPRANTWATRRGRPTDTRLVAGIAISAILGLSVMALATRGSSGAQVDGAHALVLPPVAASLLSGGRKQTFCIVNRTSEGLDYTLYWGGTTGRRYALDAGHHMIHSSGYSAAPLVEYFASDAGEPVRKVIRAAVTSGRAEACRPSYSFLDEPLDGSRWPGDKRLALYGEEQPEAGR